MDVFPSPDETVSACVPRAALDVFDAIMTQDWDTPLPRCGWALRWLGSAGLVAPGAGSHPLHITDIGRELARERGASALVAGKPRSGVELW